mgnify:FL=1
MKNSVKVYHFSEMGNHCHLIVSPKDKEKFKNFSSAVPSVIARKITGSCKGSPLGKKFFDDIYYSRVIEWGRDYVGATEYVAHNVFTNWQGTENELAELTNIAKQNRTTISDFRFSLLNMIP